MNLIRCEHCGTMTIRRGASLRGAKCTSCARPLLAPGLGEEEIRGRLYSPPRYVERVERSLGPAPVLLREASEDVTPRRASKAAA
jgi:ribosomal protein S27E